jgi:hypothetical protein
MYTALRATSKTLAEFLEERLEADPELGAFFGTSMVVSLNTPGEMLEREAEGLSVWLYRVIRDDQRLNAPPERISRTQVRRTPLPVRLHYLITPLTEVEDDNGAETEQMILGKVLQVLYDHPRLRGTDLASDFAGTAVELSVRLEPLSLEELTQIWDALDRPYQLSVSYEVSVVYIYSATEPVDASPVHVVLPEYSVIVSSEES